VEGLCFMTLHDSMESKVMRVWLVAVIIINLTKRIKIMVRSN
jgi:hypothetical protein